MEALEYGNYYHIYNHGVGNRDLFRELANYEHFLELYDKYISPVDAVGLYHQPVNIQKT